MSKIFVSFGFFAKSCILRAHRNVIRTTVSSFLHIFDHRRKLATKPSINECLFSKIANVESSADRKVTIVGAGQVGMACAISMLAQNVTNELCLIDAFEDKAIGEMLDLQHGSSYIRNPKITASKDFAASKNSRLIVIPAGTRQKEGETRLDLLQRNADIFKALIPQLVKFSPNAVLLLVSNPVDVMTYVAWKASGLPINRVIGSGTNLDSIRFRFLIAQRLKIATTAVNGWIIGEHGDSSVPVWSGVDVAGVRLREYNKEIGTDKDPGKWNQIQKDVVGAGYNVRKRKGCTSWAIGLSVTAIASAILNNSGEVLAVSTSAKCQHEIDEDIILSLPCVVNSNGVTSIVKQNLTDLEKNLLHKSAKILAKSQSEIKL